MVTKTPPLKLKFDAKLNSQNKFCQNARVVSLDSSIFCSALVTTIEVTKMSGKMPWRKMFLVITIIILQLLGKLMGLWRLHTTNWLRDNGFSQGPGFTVHNVGFKEISVQFYNELYNKRISSYSYSWDHMGLKSLPKLSKSEQMKTPCFLLKK